ncbi:hypothetical protein PC9H_007701 [Pleurotus ostreatus]|uniref:Cytochrome P450 n=1 Tax=Pleurotus ostreatus TaxID=5322 RepID=A0A8H7DRT0_PLEOS|nr:uncharacterized protein PC9H_007701 [Pleurotus ostreatus]KAF7428477.1 hypothetical protein PC9H_007701 [Pleurotus ostreatus]
MQQIEYTRLAHDILHSPTLDFILHIKRMTSSILVSLLYGKSLSDFGDNKYLLFFDSIKKFSHLADPFAQPPLDILRLSPARWAKWKGLSRYTAGERTGSFLEKILDHPTHFDLSAEEISHVLMDGGVETSSAFLLTFILALACNPACQAKAQSEIDRVIGDHRMPTLEDFEHLHYIRALIKETHRFRTILPCAVPHAVSKDIRGIYHDARIFESPDTFDPERYVKSEFGIKDGVCSDGLRDTLPFGSGRRICPGIEMTERTIAIDTMNLLWGFSFTEETGKCSMDLKSYHCTTELSPNLFTCVIEVRGAERARLIDETYIRPLKTVVFCPATSVSSYRRE